jgi:4-hydroxybenzoate polyprenyltransferase
MESDLACPTVTRTATPTAWTMRTRTTTTGRIRTTSTVALLRAAHIGPTITVTTGAALLSVASGLEGSRLALVTAAVLAGQLVIGWSNDLLDVGRDTAVHRSDKPLATGELTTQAVSVALGVAAVAAVGLSAALGWRSALLHLVAVVGSGVGYNLGLKATAWSWLPYAVAFGSLPAVVSLAASKPEPPAAWIVVTAMALGTAAHFLNTLPDLADDAATGINGLPQRIGGRRSQVAATVLLLAASVVTVLGPEGSPPLVAWVGLLLVGALAVGAVTGRGRMPFRCAVAIALLDVTLLVLMGQA